MTPEALKAARHALGLSAEGFARIVRVASGRTVRRWEDGSQDIPGPVQVLTRLMMNYASVRSFLGITAEPKRDLRKDK